MYIGAYVYTHIHMRVERKLNSAHETAGFCEFCCGTKALIGLTSRLRERCLMPSRKRGYTGSGGYVCMYAHCV